jgi:acyl CoA:acetate/3-ketoacid CoA transferase alpha subunit
MSKAVTTAAAAVRDIPDGAENLIAALRGQGARGLTLMSMAV